jgi:PAS domain S-box-containing protein
MDPEYSTFFEQMPTSAWRADLSGRFLRANPALQQLLGLPDEASTLRALNDPATPLHLAPGHRESFLRQLRTHGRVSDLVSTITRRDTGEPRVVREYAWLVTGRDGAPLHYEGLIQNITERQRFESSLQITLDSMGQGICAMDAAGRVVMFNRRYQELLGFPDELMADQPTMEKLVRFQVARGDFGENFQFVDAVARGYVALGDRMSPLKGPETYLRQTRDGRTLEVHTRPLPDGGIVRTFTDVTDHVQAREALAHKQAQLAALVNNLPDRVWLKDAQGVYLLSNPAHQRFHGRAESAIVGRTAHDLFGPEHGDRQSASDALAMASRAPQVSEQQVPGRTPGSIQFMEVVKVGMRDEQDRCIGMLGIARDITARKEAEAALIAARDVAREGERAKAEFLANMSHEIRTPMNAVLGLSDLLATTALSDVQRSYVAAIRTSGNSLLRLINDILDFSKFEAGRLEVEHAPMDLQACLDEVLAITRGAAEAKGLPLQLRVAAEVPRRVLGDAVRLRQVLVNLVSNAVKFTSRGEVRITVTRMPLAGGRDGVRLAVRDTGIGIPADRMDRLFQVFSQVDASTTRQFGGTGLGLAICKRLVGLMGGSIGVQSQPGVGSEFQVDLPCEEVAAAPPASPPRPRRPQ